MKKIVSLALSTAMALSMFASVTSAATLTTQEKYDALVTQGIFTGYPDGNAYLDKDMTRAEFAKVVALLTGLDTSATGTNSYQDQNYANAWYKPYVEAVTKAGYMQGTTTGAKKLFNPNGKVTVQEMAATLVRAAKLEVPTTGINNSASAWAKGEVQAAINAGLINGSTTNFTAAATRALLVDTAYSYQTAIVKPAVTSYEVTDNGATVVFTLANGEKVTVKPTTALQPNVATTVTFTYDGKEYSESVTWTVTSATAATGAAATNLKEIDVTFNGSVTAAAAASNADNYTTTAGTIESATVLPSGNVVRLVLADGVKMTNQEAYTVTVRNVVSGTTTINSSELSFRPLDNVLPTVESVTGLGTKAVKVTFSEPVDVVNSNNFQINGTAYVGAVSKTSNDREVILRPYAAFPVGTHTLTSSLVTDFAGLKSLSATNEFTVAVDSEGPTVTEIQSTLERAVVTFSEDIDPNTVTRTDFYWVSGTTNRYPESVKQLAGNKFELNFAEADRLPAVATTLFIDSVSDYSGNVNAVKQFTVNPVVDQTRPTVVDVKFNANGTGEDTATVKFNRTVTAERANFVITNSSGTVQPVQEVRGSGTDTITLDFVAANLASGTYTLNITGVQDRTILRNTIEPYKTTFNVGDTVAPTLTSSVYGVNPANNGNSTLTVAFSEAMDPATLSNAANYLITVNGSQVRLPSTSNIRIANDYKAIVITLPATINNQDVNIGTDGAQTNPAIVSGITFIGLQDAGGNLLNVAGREQQIVTTGTVTTTAVELVSATSIEVTFNQPIESASASDFTLSRGSVSNVAVSGNKVTLTTSNLGTSNADLTVTVPATNRIQTVSGISVPTITAATVADKVGPVVQRATGVTDLVYNASGIYVPFSEAIVTADQTLIGQDLIVTNTVTGNRVLPTSYTTSVTGNQVRIVLNGNVSGQQFSVAIRDNAAYITDAEGNVAKAAGPFVTGTYSTSTTAPTQ